MFSPNFDALAGSDPRLATVEAPRSGQMQPPDRLQETSRGEGGSSTPPGPIGALTGLDLPKARDPDAYSLPPGPEVPPLLAGLPHTPLAACQELMLAIVVRGLEDGDLKYITSPTFIHHLLYIGLDPDVALKVKIAYLQGKVQPWRLNLTSLHVQRQGRN